MNKPAAPSSSVAEVLSEYAQRAKAAWARLIRKVYEADPLECPKCRRVKSGPMRVIALESRMRQSSDASSSARLADAAMLELARVMAI